MRDWISKNVKLMFIKGEFLQTLKEIIPLTISSFFLVQERC